MCRQVEGFLIKRGQGVLLVMRQLNEKTLCRLQVMGSGTRISFLEFIQQVRSVDFSWTFRLEARDPFIPDTKHFGIRLLVASTILWNPFAAGG
jgi:hypothetical protein